MGEILEKMPSPRAFMGEGAPSGAREGNPGVELRGILLKKIGRITAMRCNMISTFFTSFAPFARNFLIYQHEDTIDEF
jgi:hypothetical protein